MPFKKILKTLLVVTGAMIFFLLAFPTRVQAMHIMEGMLPPSWCINWYVISAPFFIYGLYRLQKIIQSSQKNAKVMLALCLSLIHI